MSDVIPGFRPHTYSTAAAVGGTVAAPKVQGRHKIAAADTNRSVYHQVAEAPADATDKVLTRVRGAVEANAAAGIARLLELLQRDGLTVRVAVAPTGGKKLPPLAEIVRVHTQQHAAEGEFYRDVVAAACAALGLAVTRPVEREIIPLACDRQGLDRAGLDARLKQMGAALGPPWSEEQRLAALGAWLQLPD